jgi:hypothetical protein
MQVRAGRPQVRLLASLCICLFVPLVLLLYSEILKTKVNWRGLVRSLIPPFCKNEKIVLLPTNMLRYSIVNNE